MLYYIYLVNKYYYNILNSKECIQIQIYVINVVTYVNPVQITKLVKVKYHEN